MLENALKLALAITITVTVGCHRLTGLGDRLAPNAATPVVVVPEPQIAVPVPLAPGEKLLVQQQPYYLAPGVAPSPGGLPPFPGATPTPRPTPTATPGQLGQIGNQGGAISPLFGLPEAPTVTDRLPNPLVVPVANAELAWDQIADVVSDYFPIAREQPVQVNDGVLTEGVLETAPQVGATLLEPQRRDSVGSFNRWQATLQTIRRRAVLNVTPTTGGYAIGVQATKELEDLPRPIAASAGAASLRNDNSLPSRQDVDQLANRSSDRWIPIGRDEPLEQELLREIRDRLAGG